MKILAFLSYHDSFTVDTILFKDISCCLCFSVGDIDLAVIGDGRWRVIIQAVQCPVGNGKIEYKLQGSDEWYIKLQIRNERYGVEITYK